MGDCEASERGEYERMALIYGSEVAVETVLIEFYWVGIVTLL